MKTPIPTTPPHSSQRGAALLITMLIVVLGLVTLLTLRGGHKAPELEAQRKTALALAQAKEALLGWAATDGVPTININPGRLLCPDQNNSGNSPGAICPSRLGRLPWKTLGLDDLRDGAGERLWYIVDPAFLSSATAMNSAILPTTLSFNGNNLVVVILSPGLALGALNQQRDIANQNICTNYLESCASMPAIVSSAFPNTYNDHALFITAQEVFTLITRRMTRELALGIGTPPFPANLTAANAIMGAGSTWNENDWGITSPAASYVATDTSGGTNYNKITLTYPNCSRQQFTIQWNATMNTNIVSWTGAC